MTWWISDWAGGWWTEPLEIEIALPGIMADLEPGWDRWDGSIPIGAEA